MCGFVVYRVKRGRVVSQDKYEFTTPPGSEQSFTTDIMQARRYPTLDAALNDRCPGNEYALGIETFLRPIG